MGHLTILVHYGCLSLRPVQRLAEEIRQQLPDWTIELLPAELNRESGGLLVFPAFLVEGTLVATGLPETEWLLNQLRAYK